MSLLVSVGSKKQISDSESFTRWFLWGTSAQELGKIRKFLHPHCL